MDLIFGASFKVCENFVRCEYLDGGSASKEAHWCVEKVRSYQARFDD